MARKSKTISEDDGREVAHFRLRRRLMDGLRKKAAAENRSLSRQLEIEIAHLEAAA